MPTDIDLEAVRGLLAEGRTQLVEVLPEHEYDEEHIPGAISISLKKMTPEAVATLDRARPTIVYCWDDA
ncbi:MAG: rhodanese-like domain-containing protein [Actinomycetota bacterium]